MHLLVEFAFLTIQLILQKKVKTMKMEKEQLNDKVDKETTLSAIKASYINSYKVIVADGRDFADYAYLKEKLDEVFGSL